MPNKMKASFTDTSQKIGATPQKTASDPSSMHKFNFNDIEGTSSAHSGVKTNSNRPSSIKPVNFNGNLPPRDRIESTVINKNHHIRASREFSRIVLSDAKNSIIIRRGSLRD